MKRRALILFTSVLALLGFIGGAFGQESPKLEAGWNNPPLSARLRAYWWWLNGDVTAESITHDLEEMRAKGFGGGIITDAGGASQDGNAPVPHGPTFFTPEWRALYKHTLREAHRLGLEMSLNIQSGWNLGGPMVTADDAAKKVAWSEVVIDGPTNLTMKLQQPQERDNYYRDTAVLAYPIRSNLPTARKPIEHWREKAGLTPLHFSAPDTSLLFEEYPSTPGEEDTTVADVQDISSKMDLDGVLHWLVPSGKWQVIRFGYTIGDHSYVSTSSDGWKGYALDVLDGGAFKRYWDAVVQPLIDDAGPLAGTTLKYLHTDSWEVEPLNWTPKFLESFEKYRGYDALPWLPALTGRIVNSREQTDRFLADFRKTLGDLAVDQHYRLFRDWAHQSGLEFHPESGGPHAVPIDAQRCLGMDDAPMSEFWAWSWTHRIGDSNRFFVKQPASAAHVYGHKLVLAEGFTTIGPHWQSRIWDNLKPSFDHACIEGLNRLVWHAFVCSPRSAGIPGNQYFAGTHFNPETTWWPKSAAFLAYINRCQFLLQQGLPVADALYYYGDHVPNFAQLRASDPAGLGAGYDYDVITEDAILNRLSVKDGRLMLPDGMNYRVLVLPDRSIISLPVLHKLQKLVAAGATIIGPKPDRASGLSGYPESDEEVKRIAAMLWGDGKIVAQASHQSETKRTDTMPVSRDAAHAYGKGRVFTGSSGRDVLLADGIQPDFEFTGGSKEADFNYVHRRDGDADIYFVASRGKSAEDVQCSFRIAGEAPEIWDPVSGEHHFAIAYQEQGGRSVLPLHFNPCGSMFVIFREPAPRHPAVAKSNTPEFQTVQQVNGEWTVSFDPKWGGPASVEFGKLVSWTERPEAGIKYYSGTAVYKKEVDVPTVLTGKSLWLDLGDVRELAEVKVNGKSLGIVWTPPFRVDAGSALHTGANEIEIEVVNFWPNRIVGDDFLPPEKRFTKTNIRKLTKRTPLMESGLLGPVTLLERRRP